MFITVCDNCGSEMKLGKPCPACLGLSDEAWAIRKAKDAYVDDKIGIDELERQIWLALTDPPKRARDATHIVYY
jgi:hypothetical protein